MDKKLVDGVNALAPKYVPRFTIVKDCTFEQAVRQGYGGTPERWEEIKRKYVEDVLEKNGEGIEIDFTNILRGPGDMQDGDGEWHSFD